MGDKTAIIVAVEKYKNKHISKVQFAEADAAGFAAALKLHGVGKQNLVLSQDATKATLESQMKREVARLRKDDEFFFFYAGHGFSKNGSNYITCYDTDPGDLEGTSISLDWIFKALSKSDCERVAMFLDSCESGITHMPEVRGIYSVMSENELEEFFKKSQYRVCFASSKTAESSYSTGTLQHGVWSYHLIEALQGDAPLALEKGRFLTSSSLQNYLSQEVPRTLRKAFTDSRVQTPWLYGSQNRDFRLADLAELIAERNAVKPGYDQVKQVLLRDIDELNVMLLRGFIKGAHFLSQRYSSTANSFVESISEKDVEERIDAAYERIMEYMTYKRRDVAAKAGKIVTPDFELTVTCSLNPERTSTALMMTEVRNITPKIMSDEGFNSVFGSRFTQLVFEFPTTVDIAGLIDRFEEANPEGITVKYPRDSSWCKLNVEGVTASVRVTPGELIISERYGKSPQQLLESFFQVQKQLSGTPAIKLLPLGS